MNCSAGSRSCAELRRRCAAGSTRPAALVLGGLALLVSCAAGAGASSPSARGVGDPSAAHPAARGWLSSAGTGSNAPRPVRKPGAVLLASILVPGTGQLWNGDRRGLYYLGVEAVSWFARVSYLEAEDDKETEGARFAEAHWSYQRYHDSNGADGCIWSADADSAIAAQAGGDRDRYHESLGKLTPYGCGWDDFRSHYDAAHPGDPSPHHVAFRDLRRDADHLRSRARLALTALVLNRIVSGIDAFQTARGRARDAKADGGAVLDWDSRLTGSLIDPRAEVRLSYRWE